MFKFLFCSIMLLGFSAQAEEAKGIDKPAYEKIAHPESADKPAASVEEAKSKKTSSKDEWRSKHPRLKLMKHEDAPTETLKF